MIESSITCDTDSKNNFQPAHTVEAVYFYQDDKDAKQFGQ
jgi:hypothetical protein